VRTDRCRPRTANQHKAFEFRLLRNARGLQSSRSRKHSREPCTRRVSATGHACGLGIATPRPPMVAATGCNHANRGGHVTIARWRPSANPGSPPKRPCDGPKQNAQSRRRSPAALDRIAGRCSRSREGNFRKVSRSQAFWPQCCLPQCNPWKIGSQTMPEVRRQNRLPPSCQNRNFAILPALLA
jgi:hypothetical protein